MTTPLLESKLPLPLVRRGKVREVYAVGDDQLLLIASDRASAFDVVLNEPIAKKGAVLTQMSAFWFRELEHIVPNHLISADTDEIIHLIPTLREFREQLTGRATLARRTEPIAFECVVRGYLAGSAWKEYRQSKTLAGEPLPSGLTESAQLAPPIFSPATKAESGHDENVTFATVCDALGTELATQLRDISIQLYLAGRERAAARGIIIADTKFEFGLTGADEIVLIDELLTPDSSRFWPADKYKPGRPQPSFDKQPLRDYLDGLKRHGEWDGHPPPPDLPWEVVRATSIRYQDAYVRITGDALPADS